MRDGATERSPLLSPAGRGHVIDLTHRKHARMSQKLIILLLMAAVLLSNLADQIMESPMTRIFESVMCYRYYEVTDPSKILVGREAVGPGAIGGVAEMYCKENAVQEQLAMIRGYMQLFNGFPGLLLAVPMGWAADRYGRQPIILLSFSTAVMGALWMQLVAWYWQAFDIRMVWLSAVPTLFGGGSLVVTSLFFVIIADVTTEAARASVFLRVGAVNLLANILMPPLSAWLMDYNPWIPCLIGTIMLLLTIALFTCIPETLEYQVLGGHSFASGPATPSCEGDIVGPPNPSDSCKPSSANFQTNWLGRARNSISFLTEDWRVPLLILSFLGHALISTISQLLIQYISKRYSTTFSKATLLLTVWNAVKVALLFAILPYLSTAVMRTFHLSSQQKDLYLSRLSLIMFILGWALIGLSPNIPTVAISMAIASLGQGVYLLLRSLLTSLVPPHHVARVYSVISIVDTVGSMFGGTLLAALFKRGLSLGGLWIGLPFFFVALISTAFLVMISIVRLHPGEHDVHGEDEETQMP